MLTLSHSAVPVYLILPLVHVHAVDPGFYCPNWLYLGKCYLQLGRREEARQWLGRIAGHHSELAEDREVSRGGGFPHLVTQYI